MDARIAALVKAYARTVYDEEIMLVSALASLPAPSHHEGRRAQFVCDWFHANGAPQAYIDSQKNVIVPIATRHKDGTPRDLAVFAAHTDVVFPDRNSFHPEVEGKKIMAPGIGDDTACLAGLLLAARYLLRHPEIAENLDCGILVVANSCEEGLGNLDGTRQVFEKLGHRIREYISFDRYMPQCCSVAVGSRRFRVSCHTPGGHSWADFGTPNALERLCALVERLYALDLPEDPRTTMNVGCMEGGTTVNSIAEDASLLFEFRSTDESVLSELESRLREIVASFATSSCAMKIEPIGSRPGNGDIPEEDEEELTRACLEALKELAGTKPDTSPASTDANIPLSLGIPATSVGTIVGGGAHTREEWIDATSLPKGLAVTLALMLRHAAKDALSSEGHAEA
ncbi:MAG: M20/M25/M40 family metallo-hydrolase [Atopobiaceae bacterium]